MSGKRKQCTSEVPGAVRPSGDRDGTPITYVVAKEIGVGKQLLGKWVAQAKASFRRQ